jgi:hypothetical protein
MNTSSIFYLLVHKGRTSKTENQGSHAGMKGTEEGMLMSKTPGRIYEARSWTCLNWILYSIIIIALDNCYS